MDTTNTTHKVKFVALVIAYLEKAAKEAKWPPHSVATHKNGNTTFKCNGVTAAFDVSPDARKLTISSPHQKEISLREGLDISVETIGGLIEGHVTLKQMMKNNLLPEKVVTNLETTLIPGVLSRGTTPISPE